MSETTFTFRVDEELKNSFAAAAKAQDRTSAQFLRTLMREAVERTTVARDYDTWFRSEVEQALREADDPNVMRVSHEEVSANWRQRRALIEARIASDSK